MVKRINQKHKKYAIISGLALLFMGATYINLAYAHRFNFIANNYQGNPKNNEVYSVNYNENDTKQTFRYASLGDSLSAGVGASSNQGSFPYQLAQLIAQNNNFEVQVLNVAQGGAKTQNVLDNQISAVLNFNPDLITLMIGINDMHDRIPISRFKENFTSIVTKLKLTNAKIIILNIPYLGAVKSTWPPMNTYFDWQTKRYNKAIDEVCRDNNLDCLDLYDDNKQLVKQPDSFYCNDYFHPGDNGYQLWANYVYDHYRN